MADIFEYMNMVEKNRKLGHAYADVVARLERAEKVIKYYADKSNYNDHFNYSTGKVDKNVLIDSGKRAQNYLKA